MKGERYDDSHRVLVTEAIERALQLFHGRRGGTWCFWHQEDRIRRRHFGLEPAGGRKRSSVSNARWKVTSLTKPDATITLQPVADRTMFFSTSGRKGQHRFGSTRALRLDCVPPGDRREGRDVLGGLVDRKSRSKSGRHESDSPDATVGRAVDHGPAGAAPRRAQLQPRRAPGIERVPQSSPIGTIASAAPRSRR